MYFLVQYIIITFVVNKREVATMNCGNISLKLLCILICHVIEVCLGDCWFCFQEFVAKNAPTYIDHTSVCESVCNLIS